MLGVKLKSAVRQRVEDIERINSRENCINHGAFKSIRSQDVVRDTLLRMNYVPDCTAKPTVWRKNGFHRVAVSNKIMPTKSGREILQTLLETGVVYVADISLTPKYLQNIIYDIKKLGHKIESVKSGCNTTAYRLIK